MLAAIEDRFAALGRTPKGQRAMRAIFRATYQAVSQDGPEASLELIADRAHMSQAALRHYFATRDELLTRFFVTATEWLRSGLEQILVDDSLRPRATLEQCLAWHLEFMEGVDTVVWLEASAYWLRNGPGRETRDNWYRWLTAQYADLIGQMKPELDRRERQRRAYTMLTLVLGAWITHGHGSQVDDKSDAIQRRKLLIDAAMKIAEAR